MLFYIIKKLKRKKECNNDKSIWNRCKCMAREF